MLKTDEILPLTSLRFIAALAVFGSHLPMANDTSRTSLVLFGSNVLSHGYWGVSFFFVLSGFILTISYNDRLSTKIDACNFWIARFARVYPLHLLTFIFAVFTPNPLFDVMSRWIGLILASNLLLFQSFVPSENFYFSYNAPSWSLSNEAFFYLLFPFLLMKLRFISLKKAVPLLLIIWFMVGLLALYLEGNPSLQHWLSYIFPPVRLVDFLCGMVAAACFTKFKAHWLEKINRMGTGTLFEVCAVLLFTAALALHPLIPRGLTYGFYYTPVFVIIVLVFSLCSGTISRFLSAKTPIFLGEISFAFYMVHQLVIRLLTYSADHLLALNATINSVQFTGIALLLSLSLSVLLYKYFEVPARSFIKTIGSSTVSRVSK